MALAKLKLSAYTFDKNRITKIDSFVVMINPETVTLRQEVDYVTDKSHPGDMKYLNPGRWSIQIPTIILDTTGAIPESEWPNKRKTVLEMINDLKKVVSKHQGPYHENAVIHVQWGSFLYWARLGSMEVKYSLFDNNGKPVRAEVSLNLFGYISAKEQTKEENKSSPDLTHLVEVGVGDSLPLMCNRIYKDPSLYLQVAKANNLTDFRNLKPGTKLYFPPIVD